MRPSPGGEQADARQGPTVFPILFAAVTGRAIKGWLTWRLERGERLGVLDLLAGSSSLVNTITTQTSVRTLSYAGPALVALWALSPLGGQASIRVMSVGNSTVQDTTPVSYMSMGNLTEDFATADDASPLAVVKGLYSVALLSPYRQRQSPTDPWNNVKVPIIEDLESTSFAGPDGWYNISSNNTEYSSLIGIPVNIDQSTTLTRDSGFSANLTFSMESLYWMLDCPVLTSGVQPPNLFDYLPNTTTGSLKWPLQGSGGLSASLYSNTTWPRNLSNASVVVDEPKVPRIVPPRTLFYNTWDDSSGESGSICSIYTSYVEAGVQCSGTACAAVKIRRSKLDNPARGFTLLDYSNDGPLFFTRFSNIFTGLMAGHPSTATAMQVYILDPENPFGPLSTGQGTVRLSTVDPKLYALRFAQLLNTLWSVMVGMINLPQGIDLNIPENSTLYLNNPVALKTTGTRSAYIQVIQCHTGWLIALSVASSAMILASLLSPGIRLIRHGPELNLNVSTMIRDNAYVSWPSNGFFLSSAERARLLKDVRVRFGDVAMGDQIGHLAVGSYGDNERQIARARKGRLYD